jgi:hypothetical protein
MLPPNFPTEDNLLTRAADDEGKDKSGAHQMEYLALLRCDSTPDRQRLRRLQVNTMLNETNGAEETSLKRNGNDIAAPETPEKTTAVAKEPYGGVIPL